MPAWPAWAPAHAPAPARASAAQKEKTRGRNPSSGSTPCRRGTIFPAARALAPCPHNVVAPVLAVALGKARGDASPGTAAISVQQGKQKRRWEAGPIRPGERCAWRPWDCLAPWAAPEEAMSKCPPSVWPWRSSAWPHQKCSVLFLSGPLCIPALPVSWEEDRGLGPASLLVQPTGPSPGSRRPVKSPGAWGLGTEDQV